VLSSRFFLTLNILSEILINSEIIPKFQKLFEARHNTQNAKIAASTMVIISTNLKKKTNSIVEMCQNVPEEIRIREKNCVRKVGKIKNGITEVTEDGILAFLDMKVSVQNFIKKLIHITTRIL
jgi:mevalonate kinase